MIRKKIYIAGPYTKGDVAVNVHDAIHMADDIFDLGGIPYLPHLTHFWHLLSPRRWEDWLIMDTAWIVHCDAIFRLPGESKGADRECQLAIEMGIPVLYTLRELEEFLQEA